MDSGASLHIMSKNELTSGEKDVIRRSREAALTTTASGKAESTKKKKRTAYVNDLDVVVTMMLLEDSPAVVSLGLLCEEMVYSFEWKTGEVPSSDEWKRESLHR